MYTIVEYFRDRKPLIKEFEQQLAAYMHFVTRSNKAKDFFPSLEDVEFTYMCVDLPRHTLWSGLVIPGKREYYWYMEFEYYPEKATDLEILKDLKMERSNLDYLASHLLVSNCDLDIVLRIIAKEVPNWLDQMECLQYVLVSADRQFKTEWQIQ